MQSATHLSLVPGLVFYGLYFHGEVLSLEPMNRLTGVFTFYPLIFFAFLPPSLLLLSLLILCWVREKNYNSWMDSVLWLELWPTVCMCDILESPQLLLILRRVQNLPKLRTTVERDGDSWKNGTKLLNGQRENVPNSLRNFLHLRNETQIIQINFPKDKSNYNIPYICSCLYSFQKSFTSIETNIDR